MSSVRQFGSVTSRVSAQQPAQPRWAAVTTDGTTVVTVNPSAPRPALQGPGRPHIPARTFSRCSGVIPSQRSLKRRRPYRPGPPRRPPQRIQLRTRSPRACQKVSECGISQFHRPLTTEPNTVMATAPNIANFTTLCTRLLTQSLLIFSPSISSPSCLRNLVVDGLEPPPQMEHGVMLVGEQRIHAEARLCRQLLEATPVQLVREKDLALLLGKLVQGRVEFFHQDESGVSRLGTGVRRREEVFPVQVVSLLPN